MKKSIALAGQIALPLAYIHASLERHSFIAQSFILSSEVLGNRSLAGDYIKSNFSGYDVIALQVNFYNRLLMLCFAELIHQCFPDKLIAVGSNFPTVLAGKLLQRYPYVVVVCGESEQTMVELMLNFSRGESLANVAGIIYFQDNQLIKTTERLLLKDLDALPFPKHEIIYRHQEYKKLLWVLTARGCPYRCSFCLLKSGDNLKVRFRSVSNIIAELDYIKKIFPDVKKIRIADTSFLLNKKRALVLCAEIAKRNYGFSFICSVRANQLSQEVVYSMEQAGFTELHMGVESANKHILELAHKGITQGDLMRAVILLRKSRMRLHLNLIVGLPGETWETIRETALFIQKLQKVKSIYDVHIGIATAYPDTELYENMKRAGRVNDDIWLLQEHSPYYTVEHNDNTLEKMLSELESYICLPKLFTLKGFFRQIFVLGSSSDPLNTLGVIICKIWSRLLRLGVTHEK